MAGYDYRCDRDGVFEVTRPLGSAPIEGRFSGVVDIPNSCATVYIPRRIFDFDPAPTSGKPHQGEQGMPVPKSAN